MGFRFPLASVLRLREIHEEREERLLTQILAQIHQTQEAIAEVDLQIVEAARSREAGLQQSTPVAELHTAYGLSQMLKERRQVLADQLRQFEQLRDKQIRIYQAAHQGRDVLSTLRTRQRESFLADRARREQSGIDDMVLARRARE